MVIVDFEYNAVSKEFSPVIEIGAVKIKNYPVNDGPVILSEFQTYVYPGEGRVSKRITGLTGITMEDVRRRLKRKRRRERQREKKRKQKDLIAYSKTYNNINVDE